MLDLFRVFPNAATALNVEIPRRKVGGAVFAEYRGKCAYHCPECRGWLLGAPIKTVEDNNGVTVKTTYCRLCQNVLARQE